MGGLRAGDLPGPSPLLAGLPDFEAIKTSIEACLVFEATVRKQGVRQEALRGLLKSDSPQGKVRFALCCRIFGLRRRRIWGGTWIAE